MSGAGQTDSVSVVERARRYIAKMPPAISGQGGHDQTFHVACLLVWGFALSDTDALQLLQEYNQRCQPAWSPSELEHKVDSAGAANHQRERGYLLGERVSGVQMTAREKRLVRRTIKPVFKPQLLRRVAAAWGDGADIFSFIAGRSPVNPAMQDSASVLRTLYPPVSRERILLFSKMKSQGQMLWRSELGRVIRAAQMPAGPDGVWLLPQPVDGVFHPNPRNGNKPSRRSEESVRAWRYLVLESDEAESVDWARCLVQMPLRIECICDSGGKSIHALVRLDAESKTQWEQAVQRMKAVLVTLGADAKALSAVRLTRLPQARRGERMQQLLYLNPRADGSPIEKQPMRKEGSL